MCTCVSSSGTQTWGIHEPGKDWCHTQSRGFLELVCKQPFLYQAWETNFAKSPKPCILLEEYAKTVRVNFRRAWNWHALFRCTPGTNCPFSANLQNWFSKVGAWYKCECVNALIHMHGHVSNIFLHFPTFLSPFPTLSYIAEHCSVTLLACS